MPSSPKIQKEEILNTALDMLRRQGYSAINIKTVAKALGCSTQPISWQFGGMDEFRAALACTAMEYAQQRITPKADNCVAAFAESGEAFVDLAIEEPNLFRFAFMGESQSSIEGGLMGFLRHDWNTELQIDLASTLHITPEQAASFMNAMVLYAHGMATLIAGGIVKENKENAHQMLRSTGLTFLLAYGVPKKFASTFLNS